MTFSDECSATVYRGNWPRAYPCSRKATLGHEGKRYCSIHYPPNVEAKRKAKQADDKREEEARRYEFQMRMEKDRVCKGMTLEQLKALPDGVLMKLLEG